MKKEVLLESVDLESLKGLAEVVSSSLKTGDVVALSGDLGVGKTAFCKFLINSYLPDEVVDSPTFSIVNVYQCQCFPIWHCDLYRLNSLLEVQQLGLDDALSGAVLIVEWPDLLRGFIDVNWEINISYSRQQDKRRVTIISEEGNLVNL